MKIKCIVLYQPWASLVAIGAKPIEFRNRDYRKKDGVKVGDRIAIAAGARDIDVREVRDLIHRLDDESGSTGLISEKAHPYLDRLHNFLNHGPGWNREVGLCPLRQVVCTATIGEPKPSLELMPKWAKFLNDSDRLEHSQWGWPMLDVRPTEPIPSKGAQGFFWVSVPDQEGRQHGA